MQRYFVGLDLGQSQDYTALVVLERTSDKKQETTKAASPEAPEGVFITAESGGAPGAQDPVRYQCVGLHRFPLGTQYPAIVDHVGALLNSEPLRDNAVLTIDASGVGRPVCDMFKEAGVAYTGVTITGGDTVGGDHLMYRVPKRILVSTLQALMQSKRLVFGENPLRQTLIDELLNFKVTISEAANDTYGGRQGKHDDLVLAVALAAWAAEHTRKNYVAWEVY